MDVQPKGRMLVYPGLLLNKLLNLLYFIARKRD